MLVGIDTSDDSGVLKISDDLALVQSIDFFTPVVDDPYDYGQIAVANSLSDIYAMGATPLSALNVVGFPIASMNKKILAGILKGGWDKAREANVVILGGHSVKDPEIKYGLAVTALMNPAKIIRNSTAQTGDALILTKPLGTGILTTALKNEKLPQDLLHIVTENMKRLNKFASEIMLQHAVNSCTDVTGFGLLGHLYEMMHGSKKTARLFTEQLPYLPEVFTFIQKKQIPGGLKENLNFLKSKIVFPPDLPEELLMAMCDPQTSGGLLFTVPEEKSENCLGDIKNAGDSEAKIIGKILDTGENRIIFG
jgi:selenide,water dikinase